MNDLATLSRAAVSSWYRLAAIGLIALAAVVGQAIGRHRATTVLAHPVDSRADAIAQSTPPPPLGATQVHLPMTGDVNGNSGCQTWIDVQNVGADPSKGILVTWGVPGQCRPASKGPLKVECTGLIRGGRVWNIREPQLPAGSESAVLFSFTARSLEELGLAAQLGFDDVAADMMCELLFFGVVGDADDYQRFKKAFDEGGTFGGVPMKVVTGAPLAAQVERWCPTDAQLTARFGADYAGVPGSRLGRPDAGAAFQYAIPQVVSTADGQATMLSVQNAGFDCVEVGLWYLPRAAGPDSPCAALPAKCFTMTIAPGESERLTPTRVCGLPDGVGSVWLESTGPLAIVADTNGPRSLASYSAAAEPAQALHAPLMFIGRAAGDPPDGGLTWEGRVHAQNLSGAQPARVRMTAYGIDGQVAATEVRSACPHAGTTFDLSALALPTTWSGSVTVQSLPWDGATGEAQPIAGVVELAGRDRDGKLADAVAYEPIAQSGSIGLVGLPRIDKGSSFTQGPGEIGIRNLVDQPGYTDFALFIFDQNGLLDFTCQKLPERGLDVIRLAQWGFVNQGFRGSAVLSATFWEHLVFDTRGDLVANPVGLGAVVIERGPDMAVAGTAFGPALGESDFFRASIPRCPSLGPSRPRPTITPAVTPTPFPPSATSTVVTQPGPSTTPVPTERPEGRWWAWVPWVSGGGA